MPKIRMLCFVLLSSVFCFVFIFKILFFNLLRVWIPLVSQFVQNVSWLVLGFSLPVNRTRPPQDELHIQNSFTPVQSNQLNHKFV